MTVITVSGGNLFRLAADYLGDATRWDELAILNDLSDPMLTGIKTLKGPSVADRGGVDRGSR